MNHWATLDHKYIMHPFTRYRRTLQNIPIIRGEGALLYAEDGTTYVDAIASWWVNLHGHAHPYINARIKEQLDVLEHVIFSGFTHQPAITLAEKLLRRLGFPYEQLFYSDNGSTAVEVAIKMSIQYWKNLGENRPRLIAFLNSYHGDTFGAMAVSERDVFTEPFHQHLFEVDYIPYPTPENIEEVKCNLEKLVSKGNVAAFIFEPLIQGAGGMRMAKPAWLDELLLICHRNQVLTIADEVMTGFFKTSTCFAIEQLNIKPDFVCLSKALTGGYLPLGVTAFTSSIARSFQSEDVRHTFYHGHSFTANPLACTAALASLELIDKENTASKVHQIAQWHEEAANSFTTHPVVRDVRSMGLVLAMDIQTSYDEYFYNDPIREILYREFLNRGVLVRPLGNVVYVLPPACITEQQMKSVYQTMHEVLEKINQSMHG
ncbi:MAG: adenosylmethionine--8-amino-7-oxononanoate transaminase [Flavobacteriales bacterium]|nr:adenosylmethionine--8-amino-7-oxononanoate transaminase [Flavobacteriales bacterium]